MARPDIDELVASMLTGALVGAGAAMLVALPASPAEDPLRTGPRRILERVRGRLDDALVAGRESAAETRATLEHLST